MERKRTILSVGILVASLALVGIGCQGDKSQTDETENKGATGPGIEVSSNSGRTNAGVGGGPLTLGDEVQEKDTESASDDEVGDGAEANDTEQGADAAQTGATETGDEEGAEDEAESSIKENGLVEPGAETEETSTETTTEETVSSAGTYTEYSPDKLDNLSGRTLIFFHAGWCPTCQALEKDILANLSEIPSDVTILKADFDTELELRKEYGVNIQSTVVQIDENGNTVTEVYAPTRLSTLLSKLK